MKELKERGGKPGMEVEYLWLGVWHKGTLDEKYINRDGKWIGWWCKPHIQKSSSRDWRYNVPFSEIKK